MNITLHFKVARSNQTNYKAAVDIQCIATASAGSDPYIFVIERLPRNFNKEQDARFSHIADPVDMQDYPTYANPDYAYFRTNHIKLRLRNDQQVQKVIDGIKEGVRTFVTAMNQLSAASPLYFKQSFGSDIPQTSDSVSGVFSDSVSTPPVIPGDPLSNVYFQILADQALIQAQTLLQGLDT